MAQTFKAILVSRDDDGQKAELASLGDGDFMDGDIEDVIDALRASDEAERLAEAQRA